MRRAIEEEQQKPQWSQMRCFFNRKDLPNDWSDNILHMRPYVNTKYKFFYRTQPSVRSAYTVDGAAKLDLFKLWLNALEDHHGALASHVTDLANGIDSSVKELASMARSAQRKSTDAELEDVAQGYQALNRHAKDL